MIKLKIAGAKLEGAGPNESGHVVSKKNRSSTDIREFLGIE
jgi:hypothetical protein